MRRLYSVLFWVLLPLIYVRLWWRGRQQPTYRKYWYERLGFAPFHLDRCVWLHVVSLGESLAAKPVIEYLLTLDIPLLITNTTATGRDYIATTYGDSVYHCYFPYDLHTMLRRFIKRTNPQAVVMMETELWPNLLHLCQQRRLPTLLLNGRMSARSAARYAKWPSLSQPMMASLTVVAAQTNADGDRFVSLGVPRERMHVTGSIKFDLQLPLDLAQKTKPLQSAMADRPVWIAASTHDGEEALVLQAHKAVLTEHPDALLILVPRHPDRFDTVAELVDREQLTCVRRSKGALPSNTNQVFLGDTIGEMLVFFNCAHISFIGGSFATIGGHNPLEPAALQVGSLTGPHIHNFLLIFEQLIEAGGAEMVHDANVLAERVIALLADKKASLAMGEKALAVLNQHRGATQRVLPLIEGLL